MSAEDKEKQGGQAAAGEEAMSADDIKSQIKNVFNQNLEDDVDGHFYDHNRAQIQINKICEQIMDKLVKFRKPFKYVVNAVIMRRTGAGLHVTSSAYYSQTDGYVCEAHDMSKYFYCVVTVFWCAL